MEEKEGDEKGKEEIGNREGKGRKRKSIEGGRNGEEMGRK